MRVMVVLLFLLHPAAVALAETFALPGNRRIEIFPVGDWRMRGEDLGEYRIQIVPKGENVNATATIYVAIEATDEFPTPEKLARQVATATYRILDTGRFLEKRAEVQTLHPLQGFGFYVVLTNVPSPAHSSPGRNFRQICLGLMRLAPGVVLRMQIEGEDEQAPEFQQLLGMVEGLELTSR